MTHSFFCHLKRDISFILFLMTASLCGGVLINQIREPPFPLVYEAKAERIELSAQRLANASNVSIASEHVSEYLSLEEFEKFVERGFGVILDARPEIFYRLGHVPTALSLPRADFEAVYPVLEARLKKNPDLPIVIYCSGESCEDSELLRKALTIMGHKRVGIFRGGWYEWTKAGKMVEESKQSESHIQ